MTAHPRPSRFRTRRAGGMLLGALAATLASPALADENGAGIYLLGSGGPEVAILPPVKGVFIDNTTYIYTGSTGINRNLVIGGTVVADVDATLPINLTTLLWVPTTNFAGGTLALGAVLPVGAPMVDAGVTLTGPGGQQIGGSRHDSALVVGDPVVTAMASWHSGKFHFAVSGIVNVPVGKYREGALANVAFHRWAGDLSLAGSWHDEEAGWDLSAKAGFTINGTNDATDYNSGNDLHFEAAAEKKLSKQFSVGALGYYFIQVSDDSGSGAKLGAYRGEVAALGGTIAYSTVLGRAPSTFRLKVLQEFGAVNRPQGTAVILSLSVPITMHP